jgi:peroxiredoxin
MVNITTGRESVSSASSFISKNGYSLPILFDTKSDAASTYQVYSLPTTYFIDAEGYLIAQAVGAIDAETLQIGIDLIL